MSTIAIIGPDGAGKTTITRMLQESGLLPFKYLYMGVNISASNVALPTARLADFVKRRRRVTAGEAEPTSTGTPRPRRGLPGEAWAIAGLANRLADAWFRQLASRYFELRGHVVLYDRHFVLDFAPEVAVHGFDTWDRRLYRWCLNHLYPAPDLVIFLDAPGELLFARKGELTVEELERRRQAFLQGARRLPCFRRVDATRPLPEVFETVCAEILRFQQGRWIHATEALQR